MNEIEGTEWLRHYSETYIRVKLDEKSNWETAYLHGGTWQSRTKMPIVLNLSSKSGLERDFHSIQVDTSYPLAGLYPHTHYGQCALLVHRNAARQWKWGLCRTNTTLSNILATLSEMTNGHEIMILKYGIGNSPQNGNSKRELPIFVQLGIDAPVADSLLCPQYDTFPSGLDAVLNRKKAVAVFNRDFAASLAFSHDGAWLWRWNQPIAKIFLHGHRHIVIPETEVFAQEVMDLYARKGIINVEFRKS